MNSLQALARRETLSFLFFAILVVTTFLF